MLNGELKKMKPEQIMENQSLPGCFSLRWKFHNGGDAVMGLVTLVCLLLAVLWEELAYIKSHLDLPSIWFLSHLVPQRSIEALYLCQNRHTRPITPLWNFQHSEKQPPTSMNVENYVFFYFSIKFPSNLGNVENSQAMAKWPKTLKIANLAINSQKWTHCITQCCHSKFLLLAFDVVRYGQIWPNLLFKLAKKKAKNI